MAYRHKGKKKKYFSFNKGNFAFMALCFLVIAAGMFLISGQYAKAYRTQITYEKQQQDIRLGEEQEKELKTRLGQAISIIPGKSENWLMTGFEDEYHLYFRGDNSQPMAYIEVRLFGGPNKAAFQKMTEEITKIFGDVLGIAPDHMYIKYSATPDWGWNGGNF